MKEDNATVMSEVSPDLFASPHVLPVLMELFAGEKQQDRLKQESLLTHLTSCHYCRTALVFLLGIVQEYDHINNNAEETAHDLFIRFADINRLIIEAHDYEQLGAYAEAIIADGKDKADLRFPDVTAHLRICPDCCATLATTIDFITKPEETD